MRKEIPAFIKMSPEVRRSLETGGGVVALESTVITHGLPAPVNRSVAADMERAIRREGVTPATIGVISGQVVVGLDARQLDHLAFEHCLTVDRIRALARGETDVIVHEESFRKISARDLAAAVAQRASGGTTVAGTLAVAGMVGVRVFATGGIGGVHRTPPYDVSADLLQLARTPVVVVCAGAKSILDLPATLEYLETVGVPVIGYQTEDGEFPAFFSRTSGLKVPLEAESPAEIADMAKVHWQMGLQTALLVVVPPPREVALSPEVVEQAIQEAQEEVQELNLRGQLVTPYMLMRVAELTGDGSMEANLALLVQNATIAAQIAAAMHTSPMHYV